MTDSQRVVRKAARTAYSRGGRRVAWRAERSAGYSDCDLVVKSAVYSADRLVKSWVAPTAACSAEWTVISSAATRAVSKVRWRVVPWAAWWAGL